MSGQAAHSDTQRSPVVASGGLSKPVSVASMPRKRAAKTSASTPNNPLANLIRSRMAALDYTYQDVAKVGGFPSHSTVSQLVYKTEHKQPPRPETLRRLAKALEIPLDVVRVAAAQSAGYKYEELTTTLDAAEDVRIIVATMQELTPEARHEASEYVAALARRIRQDTPVADADTGQGRAQK